MQPFTRPMNSCVYQIVERKAEERSDLLAQRLLRIEALTLARLGSRLAADACTMSK